MFTLWVYGFRYQISKRVRASTPRRSGKIGKKRIKMRIKFDEPIIGKDHVLEIGRNALRGHTYSIHGNLWKLSL